MISFIAAGLASIGGKWWLIARAAGRSGLPLALISAAIGAGVAAWLAQSLDAAMHGPGMVLMLGLSLLFAGMALLWSIRAKSASADQSPHMLGVLVLLLAAQISESGPFIIFAASAATQQPVMAAIGGGLGMAATAVLGEALPDGPAFERGLRLFRLSVGALLCLTGLSVGASALGVI